MSSNRLTFTSFFDDNSYDYRTQIRYLSQEPTSFSHFDEEAIPRPKMSKVVSIMKQMKIYFDHRQTSPAA